MLKITGTVARKWLSAKGGMAELTVELPVEGGAQYPERIPFKAFKHAVEWVKAAGEGETVDVSFVIHHRKKKDLEGNPVQIGGRDYYETTLEMTGLLIKGREEKKASEAEPDELPF